MKTVGTESILESLQEAGSVETRALLKMKKASQRRFLVSELNSLYGR